MEGQRIGNYRVVRKIGQGGMGSVWEAKHEQLGRKKAIKLLRRELTEDPQVKVRFFNEAKAASRVDHPSVVKIDEFGYLPDGTAFIIMEYLNGEPLSVRLRNQGGKLPLPDIYRIGRQIASALAATHMKGIIHRDLKPDNVMLVPDSEVAGGERVKILDFGIAKAITEYSGPGAEEFKTNTGLVLGTATYMAPEQCKGAGEISEKADVYSLAIVMYRMCCGKVPFRAEGPGEIMAMHIFSQPQPLREVEPRTPEALAQLIHRMMSKEAHERPTMSQVAQDLDAMAQGNSANASQSTGPSAAVPATKPGSASAAKSTGPSVTVGVGPAGSSSAPTIDAPNVAVSAASQPSTMGTAAGQSGSAKAVAAGSRASLWVATVVGIVALLASGTYALRRLPHLVASKPKLVYWNITSSPMAQVIRKADGQNLGQTPWTQSQIAGTSRQLFVLHAEGYLDEEVWFDEAMSDSRTVALRDEPKQNTALGDAGVVETAPVIVLQNADGAGSPTDMKKPSQQALGPAPQPVVDPTGTPSQMPKTSPNAKANPGFVKPTPINKLPRMQPVKQLNDDDIKLLDEQ